MVSWPVLLALSGASLVAGTIDAVAGGGGLITLPALLAAGLPPHLALGTNKGQSTFGSGASFATFWRRGAIDRERAPWAFGWGLLGSLLGSLLALRVPAEVLKPLVLGLLLAVAAFLFLRRDFGTRPGPVRAGWGRVVPIALGIGFYDGFFGPGTGTFVIMAFVLWMGDTLARASANAKVVNFASNLAALGLFAVTGHVIWSIALPMAVGQAVGGVIGARMVGRLGDRFVRGGVLAVVTALVVKLGWGIVAG